VCTRDLNTYKYTYTQRRGTNECVVERTAEGSDSHSGRANDAQPIQSQVLGAEGDQKSISARRGWRESWVDRRGSMRGRVAPLRVSRYFRQMGRRRQERLTEFIFGGEAISARHLAANVRARQ
jgi:hypothetical protein